MGTATEEIAIVVGASLGGLLNATFRNATELIIALVALRTGLVSPFELVAMVVAVLIANSISSDRRSNLLEGILLLAAYAVLGLAFYFYPMADGMQ